MTTNKKKSPFHSGEQEIQERLGIRDQVEDVGQRFIRSYMPDQHRDFFKLLPFIVIGSVDEQGWPWISIISGKSGFIDSPKPNILTLNTPIAPLDPLSNAIEKNAKLGLIGIDPTTRRRNRMNAYISEVDKVGIELTVDQSFGNCPKYIHTRELEFIRDPNTLSNKTKKTTITDLDETARHLIRTADTFFVSSYVHEPDSENIQGIDASHRGGKPGFIKLDGNKLTIPDYYGNNLFNTLGNFLVNPKAGLLFSDFTTGDVLMLTGTVEISWEDDPEVENYKGAERSWTFHLSHGFWLTDILPFRAPLDEYSPFLEGLGDWDNPHSNKINIHNTKQENTWQPYLIENIEQESSIVKSFYLKPVKQQDLPEFNPGQHLPIRLHSKHSFEQNTNKPAIRTYTLSSAPHDELFRLSIKREDHGQVSQWLHDEYKIGDTIECQHPRGDFFINTNETKPAVLLAGGIGITPMLSMVEAISHQHKNSKNQRELTVFHASKSVAERAFFDRLEHLKRQSNGLIQFISVLSKGQPQESADHIGHIDAELLKKHLKLDDYEFFLCGPAAFMQTCYDALMLLGVDDSRIFSEAFGPAELTRHSSKENSTKHEEKNKLENEANVADIQFMRSSIKHEWTSGGPTLLELAEKNDIDAEFSCRNGSCGSCTTKLLSGEVFYRQTVTAPHAEDEVLICCAVPKKGTEAIKLLL